MLRKQLSDGKEFSSKAKDMFYSSQEEVCLFRDRNGGHSKEDILAAQLAREDSCELYFQNAGTASQLLSAYTLSCIIAIILSNNNFLL